MTMFSYLFLLFLCINVESLVRNKRIVGGNEADQPPSPAEVEAEEDRLGRTEGESGMGTSNVTVIRHRRTAKFRGFYDPAGHHAFLGIRYAEPPVGLYRFQRPQFLKPTGDIDATTTGPPCVQPSADGSAVFGSEDCLFMNIFTPKIPESPNDGSGYPVMMWIHGGGFRRGSASQYGPSELVHKGIVVVTVQYRLGSLGFLSKHRNELPGNTGLFDLFAALEWIQRYISYFGGNPNRIVPSGQGTGASAAMMLSLAGFAQHSIGGVFAMSGSALSSFAVDPEPEKSASSVSAVNACHSETDALQFVRCMQQLSAESIISGDNHLQEEKLADDTPETYITSLSTLLCPGPSVERENDDRFLPYFINSSPVDIIKAGNISLVPLLTGVTKEETSTSVKGGLATKLLERLEAVPEFLENSLVPKLLNVNTGLFSQGQVNPLLNSLFSNNNYLKAVVSSLEGVAATADKAIEVTTDALFNLPAYLTSAYWSQKSKAYLYSFEHESTHSTSQDFLDGLPLVSAGQEDKPIKGAGHGDDLAYLFDVRSLDGVPVSNKSLTNSKDLQVREYFTSMVAEFVRTGVPSIAGQQWNSFSVDGDYLKLTDHPTINQGFRKCQMGLWAGIPEILKSAECSFLGVGELVKNTLASGTQGLLQGTSFSRNIFNNTLLRKLPTTPFKPPPPPFNPFGGRNKFLG